MSGPKTFPSLAELGCVHRANVTGVRMAEFRPRLSFIMVDPARNGRLIMVMFGAREVRICAVKVVLVER